MFTEFIASFKVLIFSKSAPFGDFLVVVLHSYPPPMAYELLFIIIGLNGGTSYSFSLMLAEGEVTLLLITLILIWGWFIVLFPAPPIGYDF